LTGRPYVVLVPLLDGTRDRSTLVSQLSSRVSEARIHEMLDTMFKKGYARTYGQAPAATQAFWAECDREPRFVEASLARHKVAVHALGHMNGGDQASAGRLMTLLGESGVTLTSRHEADLVAVVVDDYLDPKLASWNREMRKTGQRWIPIKPGGRIPWIGPLFHPDRAPCWACLARPLLENRPGDNLAGNGRSAVRPARGITSASLTLAFGFAAQEIARLASGERHIDEDILSFDLKSHQIRRHRLRAIDTCPVCDVRPNGGDGVEGSPVVLRSQLAPVTTDGGWRVSTPEEVLARLEPLISPITGIVPDIEDMSGKMGLPVVAARQNHPAPVSPQKNRMIGRPSGAAGKGETLAQARVSCLAEAVERYCCGWTGAEPRRRARLEELGADAVDPRALLHFSERQYADREAWNEAHGDFNVIPVPFDATRTTYWSPAWSLTEDRVRWVPTRYCYFNYVDDDDEDHEFCFADSNGCASGAILEEAILQGLLELVERDACSLFWYNRIPRPVVDLDDFATAYIEHARERFSRAGENMYVLDLTTDLDISVFLAISTLPDGSRILLGLGAHLDPRIAVSRAIAELSQMAALQLVDEKGGSADKDMEDWLANATLATEPYLAPGRAGTARIGDYELPAPLPLDEAVRECVSRVQKAAHEVIVMDMSRPDVSIACARVLAPGLRHFWARYAPGRLYDTPVALGWLAKPTAEDALNPRPFFL
jgi:bacteriocin biosynthesis cyclodehydratase domain-containing protein